MQRSICLMVLVGLGVVAGLNVDSRGSAFGEESTREQKRVTEATRLAKRAESRPSREVHQLLVSHEKNFFAPGKKLRIEKSSARFSLKPNQVYIVAANESESARGEAASPAASSPSILLCYPVASPDGFSKETVLLSSGDRFRFVTPSHLEKGTALMASLIDFTSDVQNLSDAILTIHSQSIGAEDQVSKKSGFLTRADQIWNLNFAHQTEEVDRHGVVGDAADHWNFIEYGQTSLAGLSTADGAATDVEVRVSENDGEWGIAGENGPYHAYIYHNCRCVDLSLEMRYLPEGTYAVYVFAHGDAPDQNAAIEVECAGVMLSGKSTRNDGTWDFRGQPFSDGNQYVRYVIDLPAGELLKVTSRRDGSPYSMFNAIQLERIGEIPGTRN
ncbi:hypothetical protein AB1L42_03730 [Thalassoglobus sp. JC818]|uniref:hypothetical protein n=1 Tax=Thalassoglobus sp. JC818 TaxID=3232136 RepID=UPI003458F5DB